MIARNSFLTSPDKSRKPGILNEAPDEEALGVVVESTVVEVIERECTQSINKYRMTQLCCVLTGKAVTRL